MTLCKTPSPGEIWLAYLHFADKPQIGKVRPILIMSESDKPALAFNAICLKITSSNVADGRVSYPIENWADCGLRKPSYIRLDQIFEIGQDDLLRDEPLGKLPVPQFQQIEKRLAFNSR